MTPGTRLTSLLAASAAALALGACGDADTGDPIPDSAANSLLAQLDDFQQGLDDGECDNIAPRIQNLQSEISRLGSRGVGEDVQNALDDGVTNLRTLANGACDQPDDEVETTPTETATTPTETITTPTETITTPTVTTPTTTTPTDPDESDGGGQFEPGDGGAGPDGEGAPGKLKKDKGDG